MKIRHTKRSRELEAEVREINEFIEGHDLQHGVHHGYRRIFNCGDAPDFAWNKGGRLYSQGESYQQLSQADRLKMLIDGEPVVEIDIRASFLTILHALRGRHLDLSRDPYAVAGLPRNVIKAWITMTLGHDRFHTRWPREISKDWQEEHPGGEKLGKVHPVRKVQEAVLSALPVLADWPEQDLTCFDLMYLESEALSRTMLRLKRERARGLPERPRQHHRARCAGGCSRSNPEGGVRARDRGRAGPEGSTDQMAPLRSCGRRRPTGSTRRGRPSKVILQAGRFLVRASGGMTIRGRHSPPWESIRARPGQSSCLAIRNAPVLGTLGGSGWLVRSPGSPYKDRHGKQRMYYKNNSPCPN